MQRLIKQHNFRIFVDTDKININQRIRAWFVYKSCQEMFHNKNKLPQKVGNITQILTQIATQTETN